MSSGYSLRFKSGKWYVRLRDGHGKVREKSTPFGRDEKRRAQDYARDLVVQAARVRDGLEGASEKLTLADLWRRFEPIARQKRSWKSLEGRWRRHILPELGHKQIHAIEPADIEALMAKKRLPPDSLSAQTVEHLRVHLAAAYTYAIRKLRVLKGENPARIAERPRIPPPRIRFLDPVSMDLFLGAIPPQWAGIFAVGAFTGLRKGEILGLQLGDVDLLRFKLWVWRSYDRDSTKGGKGRVVGFPPALLPHLRQAMARALELKTVWLFADDEGKMRTPDTKLTQVTRAALKRAGIQAARGFSFKDLRSTFATHLVEQSGDLAVAQQQLGHSSPVLTKRHYAFARDRHLVEQVAKLPYGTLAHPLPTKPADPDQTQPTSPEPN